MSRPRAVAASDTAGPLRRAGGRRWRIAALTSAALAAAAVATGLLASGGGSHGVRPDPLLVTVSVPGATGASEQATGFVVGPGRVATVAHVLEPRRALLVSLPGGRARPGRVLAVDRRDDLALIAVGGLRAIAHAPLAELHSRAGSGDPVRVLVRRAELPVALPAQIRRPIRATIRGPSWGPYRRPALELGAAVALGDSGAPVVDRSGAIAGVLFAAASDGRPVAYAVAARALGRLLDR